MQQNAGPAHIMAFVATGTRDVAGVFLAGAAA
jgi:hypothetical protein